MDKKNSKTEDQIEKISRKIKNSSEEQKTSLLAEVKYLRSYLNNEIVKITDLAEKKSCKHRNCKDEVLLNWKRS